MGEKFIIFATASAAVTQLGCRNFGRCTFHPNDEAGYYLRACKLAASVARRDMHVAEELHTTGTAAQVYCGSPNEWFIPRQLNRFDGQIRRTLVPKCVIFFFGEQLF